MVLTCFRFAVEKTSRLIREKLPQAGRTIEAQAEPIYARISPRQPAHRAGTVKQSQSRLYSTRQAIRATIRELSSQSGQVSRKGRSALPTSRTGQAVNRLTGLTPFATTLRPNLTGGTLCRSAGGYGIGAGRAGGVRYFSHSPAAPAQVVSNVSQAIRAFLLSGQKARFDGISSRSGEKQFKVVTSLQDRTSRRMHAARLNAPGSHLDFQITPTITAIGPLSTMSRSGTMGRQCATLNSEGLMVSLSVDFARALKEFAMIMNDLKRLSALGDLPISLSDASTLRVTFPGCDADSVESLCQELGISRGLVRQDAEFDARNGTDMALRFPFAPSETSSEVKYSPTPVPIQRVAQDALLWQEMLSPKQIPSPAYSNHSLPSDGYEQVEAAQTNPWLSSPSGYSSLHGSGYDDVNMYFAPLQRASIKAASHLEGVEGIYRFLEECDRARR